MSVKRVIKASTNDRYLVNWLKYENGSEFDDNEYYCDYVPTIEDAIKLLDDVSDSAEYGGIFWAGGWIDDEVTGETVYELTSEWAVYDHRGKE